MCKMKIWGSCFKVIEKFSIWRQNPKPSILLNVGLCETAEVERPWCWPRVGGGTKSGSQYKLGGKGLGELMVPWPHWGNMLAQLREEWEGSLPSQRVSVSSVWLVDFRKKYVFHLLSPWDTITNSFVSPAWVDFNMEILPRSAKKKKKDLNHRMTKTDTHNNKIIF